MLKKILIVLLVIFVLIQFYRPARNLASQQQPNDISQVYAVPENVHTILNKACYDCHSNNTRYPWYAEIQPVRFFWMTILMRESVNLISMSLKPLHPGDNT